MKRKSKLYVKPKKPYESERIKEENVLIKRYGLKNKKEVWKTLAKVNYFRGRAKSLANATPEEQENFFNKLKKIGLNVETIADVLALKVENLLERRLPTVVSKKGLASTPRQARQMIVHKKVTIDGNVVNTPSYIVKIEEESKIAVRENKKAPKPKAEEAPVEAPAEEKAEEKPVEEAKPEEEKDTQTEEKKEESE